MAWRAIDSSLGDGLPARISRALAMASSGLAPTSLAPTKGRESGAWSRRPSLWPVLATMDGC
jgi:hypothetical protein